MPIRAYQYFPEVEIDFIKFLENQGDNFKVIFWDNFMVNFRDNFMPLGAYQCFPEVELDFVWFLEHFLLLVFSPELPEPYYCFQQTPKIIKVQDGFYKNEIYLGLPLGLCSWSKVLWYHHSSLNPHKSIRILYQ